MGLWKTCFPHHRAEAVTLPGRAAPRRFNLAAQRPLCFSVNPVGVDSVFLLTVEENREEKKREREKERDRVAAGIKTSFP